MNTIPNKKIISALSVVIVSLVVLTTTGTHVLANSVVNGVSYVDDGISASGPWVTPEGIRVSRGTQAVDGAGNYNSSVTLQNTTGSTKTIQYKEYLCRCAAGINSQTGSCEDFWPNATSNGGSAWYQDSCQHVVNTLTLAPSQSSTIQLSVSQYQGVQCGTLQTDLAISSVNGSQSAGAVEGGNLEPIYGTAAVTSTNCSLAPPVTPTVTLLANGQSGGNVTVTQGSPVTLSWTSAGVGYCTTGITNWGSGTNAQVPTSGSQAITPVTGTYGIQCSVTQGSPFVTQSNVGVVVQSAVVTPTCTPNTAKQCINNSVYNFDSCGNQGSLYQTCGANQACSNGACVNNAPSCTQNASQRCLNNSVYNYDSCGNQGSLVQTCGANQACSNGACVNNAPNCTQNYQERCLNNSVYNYDSCGNQGSLVQTCGANQACQNGTCINNAPNCTPNYQQRCNGNSVYNYDSCGNQGTLVQTCNGNQTCSGGTCITNTPVCTQNSYERCNGNSLYWYDSCGNQQNLIQYCTNGCNGSTCNSGYTNPTCTANAYERCVGSNLYWYDSCGNQQAVAQYCSNGCNGTTCNNYATGLCTPNSYERCNGNNLTWYDSCGNQGSVAQYCLGGCNGTTCNVINNNGGGNCYYVNGIYTCNNGGNGNNCYYVNGIYTCNNNININTTVYGSCTPHAYKLCSGNTVYWYDSCGNQQEQFQGCGNLTCQYGSCVNAIVNPQPAYVAHYYLHCSASSLYWFDSNGRISTLYRTCSGGCTGSVCTTTTVVTPPSNGGGTTVTTTGGLTVSFEAEQPGSQWSKLVNVGNNQTVDFMVTVNNASSAAITNANVVVNMPGQIVSVGNVQTNGTASAGDILSGIVINSLPAGSSQTITFEGKTQAFSVAATAQATVNVNNTGGSPQSDSVTLNFNPTLSGSGSTSSISNSSGSTSLWDWIKQWYLWILALIILIFLFVVIFRRISTAK